VKREVLEETGVDITRAVITQIKDVSTDESEKTLKTGERVLVKMNFYDFEVRLSVNSELVELRFEDDYADTNWYGADDLKNTSIGPATKATLEKLHFIEFSS